MQRGHNHPAIEPQAYVSNQFDLSSSIIGRTAGLISLAFYKNVETLVTGTGVDTRQQPTWYPQATVYVSLTSPQRADHLEGR